MQSGGGMVGPPGGQPWQSAHTPAAAPASTNLEHLDEGHREVQVDQVAKVLR